MANLCESQLTGLRDLSYRLGYLLPLALGQKLQLLAEDDPELCMQRLQQWLEELQS